MRVPQSVSVRPTVIGTAGGCLSRACPVLHVPMNSEPWSSEAETGDQGRGRCRHYVLLRNSTVPHPEMPLCCVGRRLQGDEKKSPAFYACGIQGHISMGACLRPHSCCLETPGRFITWSLSCLRPQNSLTLGSNAKEVSMP